MPRVALPSGIELDYAERGEGPALLLVMGIGAQRVHWPEGLIERLVARGLRVISYDNRDCGQSSVLDDLGTPSVPWTALRGALGAMVLHGPDVGNFAAAYARLAAEGGALEVADPDALARAVVAAQDPAFRAPFLAGAARVQADNLHPLDRAMAAMEAVLARLDPR